MDRLANIPETLFRFMVAGLETAPTTGMRHVQGFICFATAMRMTSVKNVLGDTSAHLEAARGTVEQNVEYCTKEGNRTLTRGEPPAGHEGGGEATRKKYEEARQLALEEKFMEIDPSLLIRHYGNLRKIATDFGERPPDLDACCGLWLYGVPGVGKSTRARSLVPDSTFVKPLNKWWDGYKGERCVILDDVDHQQSGWIFHFLKIWADKYAFVGECKGYSRHIRPQRVVVTSNYKPEDLVPVTDEQLLAAIKRRFEVVEIRHWNTEE